MHWGPLHMCPTWYLRRHNHSPKLSLGVFQDPPHLKLPRVTHFRGDPRKIYSGAFWDLASDKKSMTLKISKDASFEIRQIGSGDPA